MEKIYPTLFTTIIPSVLAFLVETKHNWSVIFCLYRRLAEEISYMYKKPNFVMMKRTPYFGQSCINTGKSPSC